MQADSGSENLNDLIQRTSSIGGTEFAGNRRHWSAQRGQAHWTKALLWDWEAFLLQLDVALQVTNQRLAKIESSVEVLMDGTNAGGLWLSLAAPSPSSSLAGRPPSGQKGKVTSKMGGFDWMTSKTFHEPRAPLRLDYGMTGALIAAIVI